MKRLFQFKKTKRKISKDKKIKAINKLKNFSSSPKMPYILGTRHKKLFLKDTNLIIWFIAILLQMHNYILVLMGFIIKKIGLNTL